MVKVKQGGRWSPDALQSKLTASVADSLVNKMGLEEDDLMVITSGEYTAAVSVNYEDIISHASNHALIILLGL